MNGVELATRDEGRYAVVEIRGELDLANVADVDRYLELVVVAHGPRIVLDMAGLRFIDSTGLSVLVRALKRVRGAGGQLSLAAIQPRVRYVLKITKLLDAFSVFATVPEATDTASIVHGGGLPA